MEPRLLPEVPDRGPVAIDVGDRVLLAGDARAPWSEMYIVAGAPDGSLPMSLTSGASSDGSVCKITDDDPRGVQGPEPEGGLFSHP